MGKGEGEEEEEEEDKNEREYGRRELIATRTDDEKGWPYGWRKWTRECGECVRW